MNASIKTIELEIFMMNDSYTVIKLINICGIEPEMRDGYFVTTKKDKIDHGIGLKSVQRTLDKYGAKIKCSYEKTTKTFSAVILINNSKKE